MSKKQSQTVEQRLDPESQQFVEQFLRPLGRQTARDIRGVDRFSGESFREFMSPFQSEVVDATRADFAHQREAALNAGRAAATQGSGGRGSRAAVLQSQLLDDVNRAEASALARLRERGFGLANQLALQGRASNIGQLMSALQAGAGAVGPTGQTTTQSTSGGGLVNTLKDLAGVAQVGAGLFFPPAAATGAASSFLDEFTPFEPTFNPNQSLFG